MPTYNWEPSESTLGASRIRVMRMRDAPNSKAPIYNLCYQQAIIKLHITFLMESVSASIKRIKLADSFSTLRRDFYLLWSISTFELEKELTAPMLLAQ